MAASNQKQKDAVFLGDGKTGKKPAFFRQGVFNFLCLLWYDVCICTPQSILQFHKYITLSGSASLQKVCRYGLQRLKSSACHPLGTAGEEGEASGHAWKGLGAGAGQDTCSPSSHLAAALQLPMQCLPRFWQLCSPGTKGYKAQKTWNQCPGFYKTL